MTHIPLLCQVSSFSSYDLFRRILLFSLLLLSRLFSDQPRAYKRQRVDSTSTITSTATSVTTIDNTLRIPSLPADSMHVPQSDQSPRLSVSINSTTEAGPSSLILDKASRSNGFTNGNGLMMPMANGSTKGSSPVGNGVSKHSSIARVSLPGSTLYEDPYVDRQEFVRLVIQSLRDVGYM